MIKQTFLMAMLLLTSGSAYAQNKIIATPDRHNQPRQDGKAANQLQEIRDLRTTAQTLAAELAKRTLCEGRGEIYINGHAAADSDGCVNPNDF